jgi:tetratricopeptide (TPR) repeat protein
VRASIVLPLLIAGCAYYNAMWSAERFANQARRLERDGRIGEARAAWAQASVKAESVLARHPRSRWADDALVLRAEGLANSGACNDAGEPLEEAYRAVTDTDLAERVALARAQCALATGDPITAASVLDQVLESSDAERASRACYLAGRAAWARGDTGGALTFYGRSDLPAARLAQARALLELKRSGEALALFERIEWRAIPEQERSALVDSVARGAGAESASVAVNRLLAHARLTPGERGRLLLADAMRLRSAGHFEKAGDRYRAVSALVSDSVEGATAAVHLLRIQAAQATDTAALRAVLQTVQSRRSRDGRGSEGERLLTQLLREIIGPHGHVFRAFRAAELARDSLGARELAARLFLDLARERPASVFAPKALVAALGLGVSASDSILGVLRGAYAQSPYTKALAGEHSPAFAVLEDSLARALGMDLVLSLSPALPGSAPRPGRRGPWLDEAPPAAPIPSAGRESRERNRPSVREH